MKSVMLPVPLYILLSYLYSFEHAIFSSPFLLGKILFPLEDLAQVSPSNLRTHPQTSRHSHSHMRKAPS